MNNTHFKSSIAAFSLIELMIVVALVGIIAVFAIPNYMANVMDTKVKAMWQMADSAKLEVEANYLKNHPSLSSINVGSGTTGYTSTDTNFIKCITIQQGIVSVVGIPGQLRNENIWVSWEPSVATDVLTWNCKYSSDAAKYMGGMASLCVVGVAAYATDAACN